MAIVDSLTNQYQLGYVARDLERAMAAVEREIGPVDFMVTEPVVPVLADGVAGEIAMRVALATRGRQQIEIIEPVSGLTGIYTQAIDFSASDIIFHHVGIAVTGGHDNWIALEAELATKGQGFKLLFPPEPGPDPVVRYGYIDTRKWCGHYTEYLWWSDAMNGVPTFPDKALFG